MRVTKDLLEAKRASLLEQLRKVDQDIEDLTPPEPTSGCVRFSKQFRGNPKQYAYAAVRAEGRWYVTGYTSPQNVTWPQLLDFIRKDNALIHSFVEVTSLSATVI